MSDESPRERRARRGYSLTYRGKTLLSLVDPIAQAERLIDGLAPWELERTLFLVPSPLYGYGLETLLRRMGPDSAALCVELDPRLLALSGEAMASLIREEEEGAEPPAPEPPRACGPAGSPATPNAGGNPPRNAPPAAPRLLLTGDMGAEGLCALVRRVWGPRRFRRLKTLRLSGGWQLAEQGYAALERALEGEIAGAWGNALTLVRLGRRYILNFIRNLALIPRGLDAGRGILGGAPALVLGAGPSLDAVLEEFSARIPGISRREGRAFRIIAVDTALRCLLERGIEPDLVVALESQHWNLRDFSGPAVPLAMDMSALPATERFSAGAPMLFFTPWTALGLLRRLAGAGFLPAEIPPLGSVGLSATALALRLGSGPVLLGGLDFSFSLDQLHARSAPGSLEKLVSLTRLRSPLNAEAAFRGGVTPLPSRGGPPVLSGGALKRYRDLFEREFSGDPRLFALGGSGLPLGLPLLEAGDALALLRGPPSAAVPRPLLPESRRAEFRAFLGRERDLLLEMRGILTGPGSGGERLAALLGECDYLWAHFPDHAGAAGVPAGDSFLRRVRAELDPFIRQWELTLKAM